MIGFRRAGRLACLLGCAIAPASAAVAAHPLHTATLTLSHIAAKGELRGSLRMFRDDLVRGRVGVDSIGVARYLERQLVFSSAKGVQHPVRFGAPTQDGEVVQVPIGIAGVATTRGLRAQFAVLHEQFPDQVNIVRLKRVSGEVSVLFLAGDGAKALP